MPVRASVVSEPDDDDDDDDDDDEDEEAPRSSPKLKGSIGEGPNHSNFLDQSSVTIVSEFRKFC